MPARARKTVEAVQGVESEDAKRTRLLKKAYGKASQELRALHQEEFTEMYRRAATDLGVDYTPRRSPEQKAADEFDALIEAYPFLRERLANPDEDNGDRDYLASADPQREGGPVDEDGPDEDGYR